MKPVGQEPAHRSPPTPLLPAEGHEPLLSSLHPSDQNFSTLEVSRTQETELPARTLDLRSGMFRNESGIVPTLACVKDARRRILESDETRAYLPPQGLPSFLTKFEEIIFQAAPPTHRISIQTIGGAGALRLAAEHLKSLLPCASVVISDRSWGEHQHILSRGGLHVDTFPYEISPAGKLEVSPLLDRLARAPFGSAALFQVCSHNPTGIDPSPAQWMQIADHCAARGITPLLDLAYLGIGAPLQEDLRAISIFSERCPTMLVATSCCKSFSLYDHRVGMLTVQSPSAAEAGQFERGILSEVKALYSSPPRPGADIIATILSDDSLYALWHTELSDLRQQILMRRTAFAHALQDAGIAWMFPTLEQQRGIFAWGEITPAQVKFLSEEHGILLAANHRICLAALPDSQVDRLARLLARSSEVTGLPSHGSGNSSALGEH